MDRRTFLSFGAQGVLHSWLISAMHGPHVRTPVSFLFSWPFLLYSNSRLGRVSQNRIFGIKCAASPGSLQALQARPVKEVAGLTTGHSRIADFARHATQCSPSQPNFFMYNKAYGEECKSAGGNT